MWNFHIKLGRNRSSIIQHFTFKNLWFILTQHHTCSKCHNERWQLSSKIYKKKNHQLTAFTQYWNKMKMTYASTVWLADISHAHPIRRVVFLCPWQTHLMHFRKSNDINNLHQWSIICSSNLYTQQLFKYFTYNDLFLNNNSNKKSVCN